MNLSAYLNNRNQTGMVIGIGYDGLRFSIKSEIKSEIYELTKSRVSDVIINNVVISIAVDR